MLKKQLINKKELSILTQNPIILFYHFSNVSTKNWQFLKKKIQKMSTCTHRVSNVAQRVKVATEINTLIIQNKIGNEILNKIQISTLNSLQINKKNINVLGSEASEASEASKAARRVIEADQRVTVAVLSENNIPINLLSKVQSFFSTKKKKILRVKKGHLPTKGLLRCPISEKDNKVPNLFQGPTLIVACKTTDQLTVIYNLLKKSSNFIFIGGWYNYQKMSHLTIRKIIKINDEKFQKENLIQFFEKKKLFILKVKNHLLLNCCNLLQLFKIIKNV